MPLEAPLPRGQDWPRGIRRCGGLGPQAIGILNDMLASSFGDSAVRYSLLLATIMTACSAIHFLLAARTLHTDLEAKNR